MFAPCALTFTRQAGSRPVVDAVNFEGSTSITVDGVQRGKRELVGVVRQSPFGDKNNGMGNRLTLGGISPQSFIA